MARRIVPLLAVRRLLLIPIPMMTRRFTILVGGIAGLAAGIAFLGLMLAARQNVNEGVSAASSVTIGGPFTLIDTNGKTVTDQTYRGKWILIYFGYTFCPDACPTALNDVSVALEKLGARADRIQPLFITVDPKRDTPQVMAEYLKSFDHRIVGLTGSQAQTDSVAKAYRVYAASQESDGDHDHYLVDHSAYFYLMNRDGKFVNVIAGDLSGDQIADRLLKMMAHPRSWMKE